MNLSIAPWEIVLRSVAIYVGLLVALRVFGKREIGQFALHDLVLVLLVANAVQPAITGPDTSLPGGFLIVGTLVIVNFAVSRLDRFGIFHRLMESQPAVIIRDGVYMTRQLAREGIPQEDADAAIREHGLSDVSEVRLGVLEPDGSISIVAGGADIRRTRRLRRSRRSR